MGKVLRPHGLKGHFRVQSYATSEETFRNAGAVYLKSSSGENLEYVITSVKYHKNILLMKLKGLDSVEQAETLRGEDIYINKKSLSPKEENEYFWYEISGLDVFLKSGEYLGKIGQIIPTGGNDIYVIKKGNKEMLVPAIYDVIQEIDLENGKMIISAMEGLLDLDEV
jgi:16S rRNA processing protein RimM